MIGNWPSRLDSDELVIYALLVVIGVIPVVIALVQRAVFGVEATLGLLIACVGIVGVVVHLWRARHARSR